MKRFLLTTVVIIGLFTISSCTEPINSIKDLFGPSNNTEEPSTPSDSKEPDKPFENNNKPKDQMIPDPFAFDDSDLYSGKYGYTELKKTIKDKETINSEETWTEIDTDDISVLEGIWKEETLTKPFGSSYVYKYVDIVQIKPSQNQSEYDVIYSYEYDYSAAVRQAGEEDLWSEIKESNEIPQDYTIDEEKFIATYTNNDYINCYVSIEACFGNAFVSIFGNSTPNTKKFYFNEDKTKFKIYDPDTDQLTIYIKTENLF